MKRFIERFEEIASRYPDRLALDDTVRSLTYREFDIESGKVYSYLKRNGIGREDHVLILKSRGVQTMVCAMGILKAGAVFVPLETSYPKERIDYITKDASPACVIDDELYERIINDEEYLEGHEETDLHDAAFIIYTSGSTGTPKGVIIEFGNIEQNVSTTLEKEEYPEVRHGLIVPFYFVAAWGWSGPYILQACSVYIVPREIVRDIDAFSKYVIEKRIRGIFLSPSYIRLFKNPGPYLEEIVTGSEPANGCFYPGGKPVIKNVYGMTE